MKGQNETQRINQTLAERAELVYLVTSDQHLNHICSLTQLRTHILSFFFFLIISHIAHITFETKRGVNNCDIIGTKLINNSVNKHEECY